MFCYLSCATPCAVKLNGNFVGKASLNLTFLDIDEGFLEFIPLDQSFEPISYLFDEKHAYSTKNLQIIDLCGGFLLLPKFFKKTTGELKIVAKRVFHLYTPVSVACFNQGDGKIVLQTENDGLVENAPFALKDVRFESAASGGKEYLLVICVSGKTVIFGYEISEKITPVFKNICDGFSFNGNLLNLVEHKNDLLRHTVSTTWEFGKSVNVKNHSITSKRAAYSLPEGLIPYAFFEEVLVNGDVANFLTPRLKLRAGEFKEFLGAFKSVLPPPHFKNDDLVTLVYDDKVAYAKVHLVGGLIDNITLE